MNKLNEQMMNHIYVLVGNSSFKGTADRKSYKQHSKLFSLLYDPVR